MDKIKDLDNDELILQMKEFRDDCELGNADMFARMTKAEEFKIGKQWDDQVRSYRKRKGKFCLTIPLVKPTIKQVVGSQIQNPKDVTVIPERSSSATGARVRTRMVKHAMDSENAVFELTQWFESGVSSGLGFIGAFIDRHEDPLNGNLTIERLNEFECGLDPNCISYDINSYTQGAKYFIWEPWVDRDLVEEQYPKQKEALQQESGGTSLRDVTGLWSWLWNSVREVASSLTGYHPTTGDSLSKYKYQQTHTWWRRPKTCVVVYLEDVPETDAMTFIKDKDIKGVRKLAKKYPKRVTVKDVVLNVLYHTIRVGDVLLDNIEDELNGVTRYPIGCFSAYFDNGYRAGMAEDMIGTQEEINWGHSQNLQIIKHLSTFHWMVKEDPTGKVAEFLEAHADEDNLVIDQSMGGGNIEKSQSKPYLSGIDKFVEMAKENLKLITNVRSEDPSFDSKNMSGKAIALKQMNSQTGQASVFHNYDYALNLFGTVIDEIITANDIYSPDEIRAIVETDDLIDAEMMSQARQSVMQIFEQSGIQLPEPQQFQQTDEVMPEMQQEIASFKKLTEAIDELARPIAEDMLMEEIKNLRKGRYTTKVALSPYSLTSRMGEQTENTELNKALIESGHAPLSRKQLIESSDVKNKTEILAEDEAMQQQLVQAVAEEKAKTGGVAA